MAWVCGGQWQSRESFDSCDGISPSSPCAKNTLSLVEARRMRGAQGVALKSFSDIHESRAHGISTSLVSYIGRVRACLECRSGKHPFYFNNHVRIKNHLLGWLCLQSRHFHHDFTSVSRTMLQLHHLSEARRRSFHAICSFPTLICQLHVSRYRRRRN